MSNFLLDKNIEEISGVGEQKAKLLKKELNLKTIDDFINYFPFRYEDRSLFCKINELKEADTSVNIEGEVFQVKLAGSGYQKRLVVTIKDDTGTIDLIWFKGYVWVGKLLKPATKIRVYGKPTFYLGKPNIVHPEICVSDAKKEDIKNKLEPVYRTTEILSKRYLNSKGIALIQKKVINFIDNIEIEENLPLDIIKIEKLLSRNDAYKQIHFPSSLEMAFESRKRLKFEELFFLQLRILKQRQNNKEDNIQGYKFVKINIYKEFINKYLPYDFTNAQKKVLKEIHKDLVSGKQMNRLLQGDVGSGKTVVAFCSMLIALSNGFQSVMMAPTEILAEQHHNNLKPFFEKLNIKTAILTGSTKTRLRNDIQAGLEVGYIKVIFGTHALLEDKVVFKDLGLAVIDEQHRFGVAQRARLWKKNKFPPHILVMTATPIPRTLAMTVYGDLDISVIDELPAGRKKIKTAWMKDSSRLRVFGFMKEQIDKGNQVYVVYPLIEESSKLDYKNLEDGYESIKRAFPGENIGILHGKMRPEDKDFEMSLFKENKTKIMVSTTVIEVGIDVPNATVMVIESAERFGLSQLHQLRGRVGRGPDQSYCILVSGFKLSKESKERLATMVKTSDGFEIANADLKLRGPGNLMGTQQSGILELKLADLVKDENILLKARKLAKKIIDEDANFEQEKHKQIKNYIQVLKDKGIDMSNIS